MDGDVCLRSDRVQVLDGPQDRFPPPGDPPLDGLTVDARGASWSVPADAVGAARYPLAFVRLDGSYCFVGGHVRLGHDHDRTTWSTWHDAGAAVSVTSPAFTLVGTTIENVGDGVSFGTAAASDWTLRDVLVRGAHDDCVENDDMHGGRIERSFFDGCYVFYSARDEPGSRLDGSDRTVTITGSLVRMKAMPHVYRPERHRQPGHGPLFKLGTPGRTGNPPRLAVHDTVILLNEVPSMGDVDAPGLDHDGDPATPPEPVIDECSGNTIVWTGDGPFPGRWPDCFEVTTDRGVWEEAVGRWERATGRDVPGGRAG